jgi:hypothetical protein
MKRLKIIVCLLLSFLFFSVSAQKHSEEIKFSDKLISFDAHPGLEFKLSEPYLRYQKWDTQKTGDSWFSIAMEFTNKSEKPVGSFSFVVKVKDKKGNVLYHGTSSCGPMTFEPNPGNTFNSGYTGVYGAFFSKDMSYFKTFKEIKIELKEVNYISTDYPEKPEFKSEGIVFDDYPGLTFYVSEPYTYLDDMSGSQMFAIALKFKNGTGKTLKSMNMKAVIHDEIGPLYEREVNLHNQRFTPKPKDFNDPNFPVDYEGVDMKFYVKDKSLFSKYKTIKIYLLSTE